MANGKINVTGRLILPDGSSPENYAVEFTLSAVDQDTTLNAVVLPDTIKVISDQAGEISVDLWPNDAGLSGTHYKLAAIIDYRPIKLRPIQLEDGPDVRLEDVMSVEIADVPAVDFKAAAYAGQAASSAEAAATSAGAAATSAGASSQSATDADAARAAAETAKDDAETASTAAVTLVGTIDETLLIMATEFTKAQTRFVNAHAFA